MPPMQCAENNFPLMSAAYKIAYISFNNGTILSQYAAPDEIFGMDKSQAPRAVSQMR